MRIIIEIDDLHPGEATVTTEPSSTRAAEAAAAPDAAILRAREAVDAGPPADGQAPGPVAETAVGGQAVDAGAAPAIPGSESGDRGDEPGVEGGGPVDAGGAPELA